MDIEEETKNGQEESKLEKERSEMTATDLENELERLKTKVKGIVEPTGAFPFRILYPSKKDKNSKVISFDKQVCTLFITKLITKIL